MLTPVAEEQLRMLARKLMRVTPYSIKLWLMLLSMSDKGGQIYSGKVTIRHLARIMHPYWTRVHAYRLFANAIAQLSEHGFLKIRYKPLSILLTIDGVPFSSLISKLEPPLFHVEQQVFELVTKEPAGVPDNIRTATVYPKAAPSRSVERSKSLAVRTRKPVIVPIEKIDLVPSSSMPGFMEYDEEAFEEFWALYKGKGRKIDAAYEWSRLGLDASKDEVISAAKQWAVVPYKPHADKFLRLGYWRISPDEAVLPEDSTKGEFLYFLLSEWMLYWRGNENESVRPSVFYDYIRHLIELEAKGVRKSTTFAEYLAKPEVRHRAMSKVLLSGDAEFKESCEGNLGGSGQEVSQSPPSSDERMKGDAHDQC